MKQKIKQYFSKPMNVVIYIEFLLVLLLNLFVVTTSDDLGYQINHGLIDIFKREYIQYMTWTGRTIAHIFARIFLALPKIIFDICNSLCFVFFTYLIYLHVTKDKQRKHYILYIIICLLVFLCVPLFGQTVLWETGSCNYLWTTTIILWFLLPYRLEETKKHNIVLLFLAGIVAGWTNENTGGALILMLLLILGKRLFEKKKLQSCEISGLVGSMVGFLLLVLAPGNKVRAQDFISTNGKIYDFIHDFYGFLDVLEKGQIVLFVLLVVSIALAITLHKKKEEIVYSIFYALCGMAAVFAIILSPVPVLFDRSMFGATTFLIIGTCIPLYLVMEEKNIKIFTNSLLACLVLFSSFNYLRTLPDLAYIRYQYAKREAYVKTQKAAGNVNPVIFQFNNEFETSYNPYYGLGDVSPYRLLWVNKFYAEVHGIESVQTTTLDKWTTIYANGDPTLMNITDFETYVETINQDKYTVLITTSYLDKTLYADYMKGLQTLGFKELNTYMTGVYQNHLLSSSVSNEEGQYLETSVKGHYVYMCSNFDETLSDVLVDNIEYTNDRPGITFVVFDNEKDKVVDSITWTHDSDQGGTRYYLEK